MKKEKHTDSTERLYKFFIYFVLIMLAITILVPVAWVFLASIKENSEFYGNPWTMPKGFYCKTLWMPGIWQRWAII